MQLGRILTADDTGAAFLAADRRGTQTVWFDVRTTSGKRQAQGEVIVK